MISYILDIFPGTALYADFLQKTGATDDIWLKQIEDILYFETDPNLDPEKILAFGRRLRTAFHTNLSGFADAIDLVPKEDLFALHADFLSRLGLTFSHGDYAAVDEIEGKNNLAENLFRRALEYGPDHRAFWGLGLIKQQGRDPEGAIRVLAQGIEHFPESEQLHLCMGINLMNLGKFDQALSCLLKFQHSPECIYYIVQCYEALGDRKHHSAFLKKFRSLQKK